MKLSELVNVIDQNTRVDVFNNDGIGGGYTLALVGWGCAAFNLSDYVDLESYEVDRVRVDDAVSNCMQIWVNELPWRYESYWESGKRHYEVLFEVNMFVKADSEDDAEEQARHMLDLNDCSECCVEVKEVY